MPPGSTASRFAMGMEDGVVFAEEVEGGCRVAVASPLCERSRGRRSWSSCLF